LITWLAATLELPFLLPYMGPLDWGIAFSFCRRDFECSCVLPITVLIILLGHDWLESKPFCLYTEILWNENWGCDMLVMHVMLQQFNIKGITTKTVNKVLSLLTRCLQALNPHPSALILRYCMLSLQSYMTFLYLKSLPFSFQIILAPLIHRLNPLVETEERSVTTVWPVLSSAILLTWCHPSVAPRRGACSSYAASIIRLTDAWWVVVGLTLHWLLLPLLSSLNTARSLFRTTMHDFDGENMLWVSFFFLFLCDCYFISIQCRWARKGRFLLK
jgi:hypothetical protein